ncbi:hypothetical protein HYU18_04800 [Candidatus Woesearchaeota archaeon]|nr:hypothetical protein [Candidatus Woesearchaeota archaeon]
MPSLRRLINVNPFSTKNFTRKQALIALAAALASVVLFHNFLKALASIAALFLIGAFSTAYKRKLEGFGAIGFELVTFTTVLAGIAFGPFSGALFGFATALSSVVISKDVGITTPSFLFATAATGGMALPLSARLEIVPLGLLLVLFSTLTIVAFTFLFYGDAEIRAAGMFGILTNLAVNYVFLAYLAKPILALIS